MNRQLALFAAVILALSLSLTFESQIVSANPISLPTIKVYSPENNKVYPSNQIVLNFTVMIPEANFSSFSYSLDGQEPRGTNQSCVITNLASGSHTLIIYGNDTSHSYLNGREPLDVVYFSTVYSTTWLVFSLTLAASTVAFLLLVFIRGKSIVARLKREKTASFWLGLICFIFFTGLLFIPSVWQLTNESLFPQYHRETVAYTNPLVFIIVSTLFMITGCFMMWFGTQKKN